MLEGIRLEQFRCFEHLEISDFSRVNLIVGKSNSGKSCLLDAIEILSQPNMQSLLDGIRRRVPLERQGRLPWDDFLTVFRRSDDRALLAARISEVNGSRSFRLTAEALPNGILAGRSPLRVRVRNHDDQEWLLGEREGFVAHAEASLPLGDRESFYLGWESLSMQSSAQKWDQLVTRELESQVIKWLQIVMPELSKVQFTKAAYEGKPQGVFLFQGPGAPQPLMNQGDGLKRLLSLAIGLTGLEKQVALIDELELGFHYSALTDAWRMLLHIARSGDLQLFVTTHSLDCLRALHAVIDQKDQDDLRLFRLRDGGRQVVAYSGKELLEAVTHEVEVR